MIKCKDFAPRITKRGPFGGPAEYEFFSEVVSAVNQWIESSTIQVINVETIVLPDSLEGTTDGVYRVTIASGVTINCFRSLQMNAINSLIPLESDKLP